MFKLTKYELRKTRATLVIAAVCFAILELAYIIGLALHKENLAGGSASFLILFACFSYFFFLVLAIMNYSKEMKKKLHTSNEKEKIYQDVDSILNIL